MAKEECKNVIKKYGRKPRPLNILVVSRYYKLSVAQMTEDVTLNMSVLYCVMVVRPNRRL